MRWRTLESHAQYSLAVFLIERGTFPKSFVPQALSRTPSRPSEKNCSAVSPSKWFSTFTCMGAARTSDKSATKVTFINSFRIVSRLSPSNRRRSYQHEFQRRSWSPYLPFSRIAESGSADNWLVAPQREVTICSRGTCIRGSNLVPAPALVRLGVAGLDSDAPSPSSTDTAHRFAFLRHRHRVGSLAAVPAHRG